MKLPGKQTVAYILKESQHNLTKNEGNEHLKEIEEPRHCLGINALSLDVKSSILYSGGRDGLVIGWQVSSIEKSVENNTKTIKSTETLAKFSSQHHSDWINDVLVIPGSSYVFTASSDRTIKFWNPLAGTNSSEVELIGYHNDFVKCLAYASEPKWLFSSGLDGRINVWDVSDLVKEEEGEKLEANLTKNRLVTSLYDSVERNTSYYSIAVGQSGRLVAGGSPDGTIRLWDPRADPSTGTIAQFTGHSDSVKALLMSQDSRWILSASSDTTIKLWSMASHRCIKTYTMHSDPVWSLFSFDPSLKSFYAGSKNGVVTKTLISSDLLSVSDVNADRMTVHSYPYTDNFNMDDDDDSNTIVICCEQGGVTAITAFDNHSFLWTSTSRSFINSWLDIPPASTSDNDSVSSPKSNDLEVTSIKSINLSTSPKNFTVTMLKKSDESTPSLNGTATKNNGVVSSIQELHRSLSNGNSSLAESDDDEDPVFKPIRTSPTETLPGKAGLTRCLTLSNRRSVLTLNSSGEVALWDILECCLVKKFGVVNLEETFNSINPALSVPSWCTVDTKIGALTVRLDESRCFDAEVYFDELETMPKDLLDQPKDLNKDELINIGKWVLHSLFYTIPSQVELPPKPNESSLPKHPDLAKKDALNTNPSKNTTENAQPSNNNSIPADKNGVKSNLENVSTENVTLPQPVHSSSTEEATDTFRRPPNLLPFNKPQLQHHLSTGTVPKLNDRKSADLPPTPGRKFFQYRKGSVSELATPPPMVTRSYTTNYNDRTAQAASATSTSPKDTPPLSPSNLPLPPINPPPPALSSSSSGFMGRLRQFSVKKLNRSPDNAKPAALPPASLLNPRQTSTAANPRSPTMQLLPPLSPQPSLGKLGNAVSSRPSSSQSSLASSENGSSPEATQTPHHDEPKQPDPQPPKVPEPETPKPPAAPPALVLPRIALPTSLTVLLSTEESLEVSGGRDLYAGTIGSQLHDHHNLLPVLPDWVSTCLFKNTVPVKQHPVIYFVLRPHEKSGLNPLQTLNPRLSGARIVRCKKMMMFVWEKLNLTPDSLRALVKSRQAQALITGRNANSVLPATPNTNGDLGSLTPLSSMIESNISDNARDQPSSAAASPLALPPFTPENWLVLMCNDQELSPKMTLAYMRQYIWKSGGDMVITYNIRPIPTTNDDTLTASST